MKNEITGTYAAAARASEAASTVTAPMTDRPPVVIDPTRIPSPPERFRPAGVERVAPRLDEDQRSAVRAALDDIAGRGPTLNRDLGRYAPEARQGQLLLRRLESIRAGRRKALALLAYLEEMEDMACRDAMAFLRPVRRELSLHAARDPGLVQRYAAVAALPSEEAPAAAAENPVVKLVARSAA